MMQTGLGVANKPMGIIVGANCLRFGFSQIASGGPRPISKMRQAVFKNWTKSPIISGQEIGSELFGAVACVAREVQGFECQL